MDIILNEKLRALRRGRDLTQRELAEKLNVSVQAVSKWERGEGYPDIVMLPQIAAFFDVSIDELMGMEESRVTEKINAYIEESYGYRNRGEVERDLALWEKVYMEFPCNIGVSTHLLHALDTNQAYERVVSLGEELWHDPKLGTARGTVAQMLCFSYDRLGDKEKAKKYANSMGNMYTTRAELLIHVLEGEEAVELAQSNVLSYLELMRINISYLCRNSKPTPEMRLRLWEPAVLFMKPCLRTAIMAFTLAVWRRFIARSTLRISK